MTQIAFEGVVARRAIAGALIFGFALLVFGCSGGDGRSAQAVEWGVSRQVGPRQIKLVTTVEYCGDSTPTIERPVIEYSGKRVFIELLLAPQEEPDHGGCLLQLLGVQKTVTLKRDLDELVLLDSSANPPERRWPSGNDTGATIVRAVRWHVVAQRGRRMVEIIASLPHCAYTMVPPRIHHIDQVEQANSTVIAVFARFRRRSGSAKEDGCADVGEILFRKVKSCICLCDHHRA